MCVWVINYKLVHDIIINIHWGKNQRSWMNISWNYCLMKSSRQWNELKNTVFSKSFKWRAHTVYLGELWLHNRKVLFTLRKTIFAIQPVLDWNVGRITIAILHKSRRSHCFKIKCEWCFYAGTKEECRNSMRKEWNCQEQVPYHVSSGSQPKLLKIET